MKTVQRKNKVKNKLIDNTMFYPPCNLVPYVKFENGLCPYSRCKSCGECLATELDVEFLEILKFAKSENIGHC